jgi:hypothetical protein
MGGRRRGKFGIVKQMNNVFRDEWAGIAQIFMIKRTVIEKGEERIEIVYGMTSPTCEEG